MTSRGIDAEVLPEVGELQRAADGVGPGQRASVVDAVEMKQQATDRVCRATAVIEQLGAVGVARLGGVLRERVEQVGEERHGQAMSGQLNGQRPEHLGPARRWRPTGRDRHEISAKRGQVGEARVGRRIAFIGDVVGRAGEAVDRNDRRTKLRRTQPGGHRKVFVVIDAHWRDSPCTALAVSAGRGLLREPVN